LRNLFFFLPSCLPAGRFASPKFILLLFSIDEKSKQKNLGLFLSSANLAQFLRRATQTAFASQNALWAASYGRSKNCWISYENKK